MCLWECGTKNTNQNGKALYWRNNQKLQSLCIYNINHKYFVLLQSREATQLAIHIQFFLNFYSYVILFFLVGSRTVLHLFVLHPSISIRYHNFQHSVFLLRRLCSNDNVHSVCRAFSTAFPARTHAHTQTYEKITKQ